MDALTYESITGLKNYYGFKSLLKNGGWTQRYGCDDDTIVFNRIESFTFTTGGFLLNSNQVGVVLNLTTDYGSISPTTIYPDVISTRDVDNQPIYLLPNAVTIGIVITNQFSGNLFPIQHNLVLAIFDLY